jgi:hypothetical protein
MNLLGAMIDEGGYCIAETSDSGAQGDEDGKNIPAPAEAAVQKWSLYKGRPVEVTSDSKSEARRTFYDSQGFNAAGMYCCEVLPK